MLQRNFQISIYFIFGSSRSEPWHKTAAVFTKWACAHSHSGLIVWQADFNLLTDCGSQLTARSTLLWQAIISSATQCWIISIAQRMLRTLTPLRLSFYARLLIFHNLWWGGFHARLLIFLIYKKWCRKSFSLCCRLLVMNPSYLLIVCTHLFVCDSILAFVFAQTWGSPGQCLQDRHLDLHDNLQ